MKVKNLFQLSSIILLSMLSTAFVQPTPVAEVPVDKNAASDFAEFLSNFRKVELPYSMNLEDLKQYDDYKKESRSKTSKKSHKKSSSKKKRVAQATPTLSRKYLPRSASVSFSRSGAPRNYPVARFYPNDKMVAVIYSSTTRFAQDLYQSYNLAIYNLKGEILFPEKQENIGRPFENQFNLGSTSHQQTVTFRIDEKGNIWKNTYENIWKNEVKKKGYRNNQLVDFQIKDTQVFQLNEQGVVEKLKAIPSESRASLD